MLENIKTTAIELMNDPARTFGRAGGHRLSDLVGLALMKATENKPLASEDFERARSDILQTIRNPK